MNQTLPHLERVSHRQKGNGKRETGLVDDHTGSVAHSGLTPTPLTSVAPAGALVADLSSVPSFPPWQKRPKHLPSLVNSPVITTIDNHYYLYDALHQVSWPDMPAHLGKRTVRGLTPTISTFSDYCRIAEAGHGTKLSGLYWIPFFPSPLSPSLPPYLFTS